MLYELFILSSLLFSYTILQIYCVFNNFSLKNLQILFLALSIYISFFFPKLSLYFIFINIFGFYNMYFLNIKYI